MSSYWRWTGWRAAGAQNGRRLRAAQCRRSGGLERGGGSELSGEPSVVWRLHSISVRRQVCAACCSRGVFRLISRSIRIGRGGRQPNQLLAREAADSVLPAPDVQPWEVLDQTLSSWAMPPLIGEIASCGSAIRPAGRSRIETIERRLQRASDFLAIEPCLERGRPRRRASW
jgi:hypothetical protein